MSLLIDNGLVLTDTTTSDRNTINSNGDNLDITTNTGNIRLQTTGEVSINSSISLGTTGLGGQIQKLGELRGRTDADLVISALTAPLNFKTNNTNQLVIASGGSITFTKQPQTNTAITSTTSNQYLTMNTLMNTISYTLTISTATGQNGVINNTTSYGRYTRFGSICYVVINLEMSSIGTLSPTGTIFINLPFPAGLLCGLNVSKVNNIIGTSFDFFASTVVGQSSFFLVYKNFSADDNTKVVLGSQVGATTQFGISGFYFI